MWRFPSGGVCCRGVHQVPPWQEEEIRTGASTPTTDCPQETWQETSLCLSSFNHCYGIFLFSINLWYLISRELHCSRHHGCRGQTESSQGVFHQTCRPANSSAHQKTQNERDNRRERKCSDSGSYVSGDCEEGHCREGGRSRGSNLRASSGSL